MSCSTATSFLPTRKELPSAAAGDTYKGFPTYYEILVNDAPPASALVNVIVEFKEDDATTVALTLTVVNEGVELIGPGTDWKFSIVNTLATLPAGFYLYKIKTVNAAGDTRTWITGTLKLV